MSSGALSLTERVIHLVRYEFSIEGEFTAESHLQDDLGLDSLDMSELALAIEEECLVDVDDSDIERFTTVGSIVEYLDGRGVR